MSTLTDRIEDYAHTLSMQAEESVCTCERRGPCGLHDLEHYSGPPGTLLHHRNAYMMAAAELDPEGRHETWDAFQQRWDSAAAEYTLRTAPAWDVSAESMSPLIGLPALH